MTDEERTEYVLVPRAKPTDAMIEAYCRKLESLGWHSWVNLSTLWPEVVSASPAVDVVEALRERAEDAESTLKAWFDTSAKADAEIVPALVDSFKGYLRTSRGGGMPTKQSDAALAAFESWARLYAGLTLTPFLQALSSLEKKP